MDNPVTQAPAAGSAAPESWFRNPWVCAVVIAIAVVAVYGQTLFFDFVTYDDYELVVQNEAFLSAWPNVLTSFSTHAFTTHRPASGYYRPLLLVSYMLDYHVWGLNPAGFHATNVLLHLATSLLTFGLCSLLTGERLAALAGALLFALHPVQSESVGWVAGRNDVLLGLFVVAMALSYVRYRRSDPPRTGDLLLTALFYGFALFTKESAAFYGILLPLVDLAVMGERLSAIVHWKYLRRVLPLLAVLAVYLVARTSVIGEIVGAEKLYGTIPLWQRVTGFPSLVTEHLRLLLLPVGLSVAHPVEDLPWNAMPWQIVSVLAFAGSIAAVIWTWRRDRLIALGLAWVAIGLLPVMNIIPLAVPVLEHRLYAPLAGGAVAAAALLVRLRRIPWLRAGSLAAATVLVTGAGLATMSRLPVWSSSETLWLDAIAKAPRYSRSYLNLAGYYFDRQRYDLAAARLEEYLTLRPDDPFASSKLRITYVQLGEPMRAIEVCRRMIARAPGNPVRYIETALFFERLGMADSAVAVCRDALQAGAESDEVQWLLGRILVERGDTAEALPHLQRAVDLRPSAADERLRLAMVLRKRGDLTAAVRALEAGLTDHPPAELVDTLSRLYLQTGQQEKARDLRGRYQ